MSDATDAGAQRLQKLLAAQGLGSRREIETWIAAGRVRVNGEPATLGVRAGPQDRIELDGRLLDLVSAPTRCEVLVYHKPAGEVTTRRDPQGRPTVFERLPAPRAGRWVVVGRLDTNTTGLLLFTTDGELANRLMHPSGEVEREYLVRVRGQPTAAVIEQLLHGVPLEDGPAKFDRVIAGRAEGSHGWYRVVLREGRNREVRRVWEAVGHEVSRLTRIRYANIELPRDLRPGASRPATAAEIAGLQQAAGQGVV
jgi:23S rRNA pseudouridine2605 synthase